MHPGKSLDPILAGWKKLDSMAASPRGEKTLWDAGGLWTATTGADGRFELRGLGAERLVVVRSSGGGTTNTEAYVATRKGFDPKEYNEAVLRNAKSEFGTGQVRWRLYGPDFTAVAEREKLVRGRVYDVDTGKPRADVLVRLTRTDGGNLLEVAPEARTDKDGRYEIRGARKATGYMVEVEADTKAGYVQAQAHSGDTSGYDPLTLDVRVKRGVVVTGRMFDKGTGKPVAGFVMAGIPQGNTSVKGYPEFTSGSHFPMENTDAEGRFRVVALPGPVLLMGGPGRYEDWDKYKPPAADPKYPQFFKVFGDHTAWYMPGGAFSPLQGRVCRVVELKAGTETAEHDLELVPAPKTDGKK
jgi:5-hydroxyisourate hydrolase-like protein (transthyretin family)